MIVFRSSNYVFPQIFNIEIEAEVVGSGGQNLLLRFLDIFDTMSYGNINYLIMID